MAGIEFKVDQKIKGEFLKHPEKILRVYETEFRKGLNEAIMLVQREVVTRTPIRTGTLRKSITTEIKGVGLNIHGIIGTPLVYAAPQEYGVDSGRFFPPRARLALWGKRLTSTIDPRPSDAQLGFLIARAIYRQGIKARHMFRDGFKASTTKVLKILQTAQDRVLRTLGK